MIKLPVVRAILKTEYEIECENHPKYSYRDVTGIFCDIIGDSTVERIAVLYLNSQNIPVNVSLVSIGNEIQSNVSEREIFRIALLSNCTQIFVCHNHPSGVLKPTKLDIDFTRRIGQAGKLLGIYLIDSIILGFDGQALSLREYVNNSQEDWNIEI